MIRNLMFCLGLLTILGASDSARAETADAAASAATDIIVFDRTEIGFVEGEKDLVDGSFVVRWESQTETATTTLPSAASAGRAGVRVEGLLKVEAVSAPDTRAPRDPWTRLGHITIEVPAPRTAGESVEVELIRFTTGFGAGGDWTVDLTPFAPILQGKRTFKAFISTYGGDPAWRVSLTIRTIPGGSGRTDPSLLIPLFADWHVDAAEPKLEAEVVVAAGVDVPRLMFLSTGHATDGEGANEFVTATHVLRVDGVVVAKWRPWEENGPELRPRNPMAGRQEVRGRMVWASDIARSGWSPGLPVDRMIIPVPELTPGRHTISLEIEGIRPPKPEQAETGVKPGHGYFAVSAVLVADRRWD